MKLCSIILTIKHRNENIEKIICNEHNDLSEIEPKNIERHFKRHHSEIYNNGAIRKKNNIDAININNYGIAFYDFNKNEYIYSGNNINKKSIFQCASLSKQVLTIITLRMMKDKKIKINKTIYDYLTEDELNMFHMNDKLDKRYRQITIKMLLTHTSGLPNGMPRNTLSFDPGTNYKYSGNAFNLLQKIIEKIDGIPLNHIYDDYKMKNSSFIYEDKS